MSSLVVVLQVNWLTLSFSNVIVKISVFFHLLVINIVNLFPPSLYIERGKDLCKGKGKVTWSGAQKSLNVVVTLT